MVTSSRGNNTLRMSEPNRPKPTETAHFGADRRPPGTGEPPVNLAHLKCVPNPVDRTFHVVTSECRKVGVSGPECVLYCADMRCPGVS